MSGSYNVNIEEKWEYITPPYIIKALGNFDLDPCACEYSPFQTSKQIIYMPAGNGLFDPWKGRVWLNPPYGRRITRWLGKMAEHNQGIALIFARTDTDYFHKYIFQVATGILFLKGRIRFLDRFGRPTKNSSPAPSCLVSYGTKDLLALKLCGLHGELINL